MLQTIHTHPHPTAKTPVTAGKPQISNKTQPTQKNKTFSSKSTNFGMPSSNGNMASMLALITQLIQQAQGDSQQKAGGNDAPQQALPNHPHTQQPMTIVQDGPAPIMPTLTDAMGQTKQATDTAVTPQLIQQIQGDNRRNDALQQTNTFPNHSHTQQPATIIQDGPAPIMPMATGAMDQAKQAIDTAVAPLARLMQGPNAAIQDGHAPVAPSLKVMIDQVNQDIATAVTPNTQLTQGPNAVIQDGPALIVQNLADVADRVKQAIDTSIVSDTQQDFGSIIQDGPTLVVPPMTEMMEQVKQAINTTVAPNVQLAQGPDAAIQDGPAPIRLDIESMFDTERMENSGFQGVFAEKSAIESGTFSPS